MAGSDAAGGFLKGLTGNPDSNLSRALGRGLGRKAAGGSGEVAKEGGGLPSGGSGDFGGEAGAADSTGKILGSLRKGGRIKRTGSYRLHKGEEVVPAGRKGGRKSGRSSSRR